MSFEESSPKRRRTSYSPASPPPQEPKTFQEAHSLHTPPPSVHMSPSWQSQSLPQNSTSTVPTPPSTSSAPSQIVSKSTELGDSAIQTPQEPSFAERDVEMEDADHRRTDHERIEPAPEDVAVLPPPPSLYKMRTESIVPILPDPSIDLIQLYSLQAIQLSVARRDLATGDKINKLRKSYETKSRNLGIEGRNKAVVQDGHLRGLIDPGWDDLIAEDKTRWDEQNGAYSVNGPGTAEMLAAIDSVFSARPGRLTKAETADWAHQLGLDDTSLPRPQPGTLVSSKSTTALSMTKINTIALGSATAPSSPGSARPDRAGKKRRYDESSYEGYDDDGYSTGGHERAKRLKRKPSVV